MHATNGVGEYKLLDLGWPLYILNLCIIMDGRFIVYFICVIFIVNVYILLFFSFETMVDEVNWVLELVVGWFVIEYEVLLNYFNVGCEEFNAQLLVLNKKIMQLIRHLRWRFMFYKNKILGKNAILGGGLLFTKSKKKNCKTLLQMMFLYMWNCFLRKRFCLTDIKKLVALRRWYHGN